MNDALPLLRSFFPPDLSPDYLAALIWPMLDTLGLVVASMTFAFLISIPLAIAVGIRVRGAASLVAALTIFRAIPDLTLAILCVILFGLGPGAGMIALTLYYTAAVTKVFADLMTTGPRGPRDALAATGASRLQIALFGLLPLKRDDLFNYGAFAVECALRSSIIIGAVGGGGIGTELVGSLAGFDFPRATTQMLLIVVVIAALDRVAFWLRRRPVILLVFAPMGLLVATLYVPALFAWRHSLDVLTGMFPPHLDTAARAALPGLMWETIWVAIVATLAAAAAGLIAALAVSRKLAPWWLALPVRRLLELFRTVPEVVWGLVLVAVAGVGPVIGVWAIGLHSFGSLGRLFADAIDAAPEQPQRAIRGTGAGTLVVAAYATLPLSMGPMLTHLLFRFEWNLRMATVLGLIGAGGIGQALYQAQQLFFYDQALAYVLVTAALILIVDLVSARFRAHLSRVGRSSSQVTSPDDGALTI